MIADGVNQAVRVRHGPPGAASRHERADRGRRTFQWESVEQASVLCPCEKVDSFFHQVLRFKRFTVCTAVPIFKPTCIVVGTARGRTSTSCGVTCEAPLPSPPNGRKLKGTFVNLKLPSLPVVVSL